MPTNLTPTPIQAALDAASRLADHEHSFNEDPKTKELVKRLYELLPAAREAVERAERHIKRLEAALLSERYAFQIKSGLSHDQAYKNAQDEIEARRAEQPAPIIAPEDKLIEAARKKMLFVNDHKEELVTAFLAKTGYQPDEC